MNVNKLWIALLAVATLWSCGKDNDLTDRSKFFECKVDGVGYEIKGLFAYAVESTIDGTIAVYGLKGDGSETIYVIIPEGAAEGTYNLGKEEDGNGYVVIDDVSYTTVDDGGTGTVTVTKRKDNNVEGTFSFTAFTVDGQSIEITDGKFEVEVRD
ncbi:MAG: DUF6252 family protein [Bacteroidota bacterium]